MVEKELTDLADRGESAAKPALDFEAVGIAALACEESSTGALDL